MDYWMTRQMEKAAPNGWEESVEALRYYLEWESQRRALPNCTAWYALDHCGLVAMDAPEKTRQAAALRYLGFVPVSPDGAAYSYDPRTDEVVNHRHGSPRRPQLQPGIADNSPLGRLLEQFRSVRADLRFREDGIHTTLTIERKGQVQQANRN